MFRLFQSSKDKRKRAEKEMNRSLLIRLHGRPVEYVSERMPDYSEKIIGKDGLLNVLDQNYLIISCGAEIVFHFSFDKIKAYELMSLDGVNLVVDDNGVKRVFIAYYKYYRQV